MTCQWPGCDNIELERPVWPGYCAEHGLRIALAVTYEQTTADTFRDWIAEQPEDDPDEG